MFYLQNDRQGYKGYRGQFLPVTRDRTEAIRCKRHGLEAGAPNVHRLRPCCTPWLPRRAASLARTEHNTRQAGQSAVQGITRARTRRQRGTRQLRRSKTTVYRRSKRSVTGGRRAFCRRCARRHACISQVYLRKGTQNHTINVGSRWAHSYNGQPRERVVPNSTSRRRQ
jgi:hypothetical protein